MRQRVSDFGWDGTGMGEQEKEGGELCIEAERGHACLLLWVVGLAEAIH